MRAQQQSRESAFLNLFLVILTWITVSLFAGPASGPEQTHELPETQLEVRLHADAEPSLTPLRIPDINPGLSHLAIQPETAGSFENRERFQSNRIDQQYRVQSLVSRDICTLFRIRMLNETIRVSADPLT